MFLSCTSDWNDFYYKDEPLLKTSLELVPNEDGASSFKYAIDYSTFERLTKLFRNKVISIKEKEAKKALPAVEKNLLLIAEQFGIKSLPIKRKIIVEKSKRND